MASTTLYPIKSVYADSAFLAGSFSIAASGGAATKLTGRRYTVAKSATGEYTITLLDTWNELVSAYVSVEAATAVDLVAQIDNHDVTAATPVVVINLNAAATPTEPAAVTVVHFQLVLSNTSYSQ